MGDSSVPARMVCISYEDARYLEGIMVWVRLVDMDKKPNEKFRQVELRLNMAVASSYDAVEKEQQS
jgi:hypothetical protein